jgi:hypothetical protein
MLSWQGAHKAPLVLFDAWVPQRCYHLFWGLQTYGCMLMPRTTQRLKRTWTDSPLLANPSSGLVCCCQLFPRYMASLGHRAHFQDPWAVSLGCSFSAVRLSVHAEAQRKMCSCRVDALHSGAFIMIKSPAEY